MLFKRDILSFTNTYTFLSQIFDYGVSALEASSCSSSGLPCWSSGANAMRLTFEGGADAPYHCRSRGSGTWRSAAVKAKS